MIVVRDKINTEYRKNIEETETDKLNEVCVVVTSDLFIYNIANLMRYVLLLHQIYFTYNTNTVYRYTYMNQNAL